MILGDCMPISGVVITTKPEEISQTQTNLEEFSGVSLYGADEKGNIIAVIDTQNSESMEKVLQKIAKLETVLHVGLTYLNVEDEADKIESGEYNPKIFGTRKHEKNQ